MANEVLELIGKVVIVGGGASAIAYQAFKVFAAKWIDSRFKRNFQELVHNQNKEIERLKNDLTKSFDRATKLHQREFDLLPDIWDKVNEAYWSTAALVSPLQTYPDVDRMQPKQFEEFLEKCDLLDWQKSELRGASNKTKYYGDAIYWHRLFQAQSAHRAADIALSRNGIFVTDDIKNKLNEILSTVRGAQIEDSINHENPPTRFSERLKTDIEKIRKECLESLEEAERLIKHRLWDYNESAAS
jgi:hypothetical protein